MESIAITATKGGVGKTTLTVHIAAAAQHAGRRVRVIDLDPQQSALQWADKRIETLKGQGSKLPPLDARPGHARSLEREIKQAEDDGVDLLVIDTPPYQSQDADAAARFAMLTIVPVKPGVLDLQALAPTLDMLENTKAFAFGVLNCVKQTFGATELANEAREAVEREGLHVAPVALVDRQDYNTALMNGLTAPEVKPKGKHADEIAALWDWLQIQLKVAGAQQHKRNLAPREATAEAAAVSPFEAIRKRAGG